MRAARRLVIAVGCLCYVPSAMADMTQHCVARFSDGADEAGYAVVVDDAGNAYVTGNKCDGEACSVVTVSYDQDCLLRWGPMTWDDADYVTTAAYDVHTGIALDADGLYVRAMVSDSGKDFAVRKYRLADGNLEWTGSYAHGGDDYPVAIARGCDGVYVVGYTGSGATDYDWLVVKFDPDDGAFLAEQQFEPSGVIDGNDYAWDVVVDSTGVYVAGASYLPGTGLDFYTIKYACDLGTTIWAQRWDSPNLTDPFDFGRAIALACGDLVLVTGECGGRFGDFADGADYCVVAYSRATGGILGNPLWWDDYNNSNANRDDKARDIYGTPNAAYVTGQSQRDGVLPDWDYATLRWNCDGNKGWGGTARRYDHAGGDDSAWVVTGSGNSVFVMGESENGTNFDYATVQYDTSTGNLLDPRYDNGNHDRALAGAANHSALYVTGRSSNGTDDDYALVIYSRGVYGACCNGGACTETTEAACTGGGGVYSGDGTWCFGYTQACCDGGGGCTDADPVCCIGPGGVQPVSHCLGDGAGGNGHTTPNGADDACEPPANDLCEQAREIGSLPYAQEELWYRLATSDVNTACNDPACTSSLNGTWWHYQPAADGFVRIQVAGDHTVTAIFTGADCDNLTEIHCSDSGDAKYSMAGGTSYWVLVSRYGCPDIVSWPPDPVAIDLSVEASSQPIPTVSEWGMFIMATLILGAATLTFKRLRQA